MSSIILTTMLPISMAQFSIVASLQTLFQNGLEKRETFIEPNQLSLKSGTIY